MQATFLVYILPDEITQNLDDRLGVFHLPPANDSSSAPALVAGSQYVVFNGKDRPEVRRFIEFLTTVEATEPVASGGDAIFPHLGQDVNIYPSQINRTIVATLLSAPYVRFDGSDIMHENVYPAFWQGVVDYVDGADLDTVLQQIDATLP